MQIKYFPIKCWFNCTSSENIVWDTIFSMFCLSKICNRFWLHLNLTAWSKLKAFRIVVYFKRKIKLWSVGRRGGGQCCFHIEEKHMEHKSDR
jgi:hypothetical protein